MYDIAIIGAGQIGSRHLQAMAQLEGIVKIQLVDPSEESLKIARERFYHVYDRGSEKIELVCSRSIDDLPETVDLGIIATCSSIRAEIIKEFTYKKTIKSLILEKVLFQRIDEYYEIDELLREKDIPTWVNCYMRSRDFFRKLKTQISLDNKIEMKVEGSLWGMGCNSIHFIDYFSFLTGCEDINFADCLLNKKIINSKRSGFIEFSGKLVGNNSHGHSLVLLCNAEGIDPIKITINNGSISHEIIDYNDHVIHRVIGGDNKYEVKEYIPFQSQTTHKLVRQIRENGICELTTYGQSMNLHIPLIKILIEHMRDITGEKVELCPIT